MNAAADMVASLRDSGVRLERRGERLHVEAPPGAITPDVRIMLAQNKASLLAALTDPVADRRDQLQRIAEDEGIAAALISRLPDDDIAACDGLPVETLRAYVRALRDSDLRQRGNVPPDETARAWCRHCGPVWTAPEVAKAAPTVDGWPRLLGCPWCHVKERERLPRPPVMCGECAHFQRDRINPSDGMGRCGAGQDPARPWPNVARDCGRFTTIETN